MTIDELKRIKESEEKAFNIVSTAEKDADRIIEGINDEIEGLRKKMVKKVAEKNREEMEKAVAEGKKEAANIRRAADKELEKVITEAKKNIPRAVEITVKRALDD